MAGEVRGRRDKWLAALLEEVKESIAAEKVKHCVASGLLTDKSENLSRRELLTFHALPAYTYISIYYSHTQ